MCAPAASLVTAEELEKLNANGHSFEIVEGVLVEEPPVGAFESELELLIAHHILNYIKAKGIPGKVLPGTARVRLREEPDTVRGPDVSFIRGERLPPGPLPSGHLDVVPDLAVEVVSGSEDSNYAEQKISEYLDARVKMLWVIYPRARTAYLYASKDKVRRIDETGELDGGDALPGFRLPLAELFRATGAEPEREA